MFSVFLYFDVWNVQDCDSCLYQHVNCLKQIEHDKLFPLKFVETPAHGGLIVFHVASFADLKIKFWRCGGCLRFLDAALQLHPADIAKKVN